MTRFDAELLLLAMAPVFLACIGWEAWHASRTRPAERLYSWRDTLCNAALAPVQQAAGKLAWLATIPVYAFFYEHDRTRTCTATRRSFVVLFVAQHLLCFRRLRRQSSAPGKTTAALPGLNSNHTAALPTSRRP
uniref:Uncharacterized protein n=1 Tax=Paraburkholderia sprentiae WSM5005 TaxID=754502 RepID=A0A1I9YK91_9BURK